VRRPGLGAPPPPHRVGVFPLPMPPVPASDVVAAVEGRTPLSRWAVIMSEQDQHRDRPPGMPWWQGEPAQKPAQRPGRRTVTTGIIIAVVGLVVMFLLGHNYGACQSLLGQLGQALSRQDATLCTVASGAHWLGLLGTIAGAATVVAGFATMANRK
jgi:hypothetical protein